MAKRDVRQLVRHHACKLCLVVSGFDRSTVHKHVAAGQSKRVDGFVIHAMKFERILHSASRQLLRQARAQLCQVGIDFWRVAKRQLLFRIRRCSLAESYIVLGRKFVPACLELCPLRRSARNQE